jgi:hypothetical protein
MAIGVAAPVLSLLTQQAGSSRIGAPTSSIAGLCAALNPVPGQSAAIATASSLIVCPGTQFDSSENTPFSSAGDLGCSIGMSTSTTNGDTATVLKSLPEQTPSFGIGGSTSLIPDVDLALNPVPIQSAADATASSLIACPGKQFDIEKITASSPAGDIVYAFGRRIGTATIAFKDMHKYVTWLRERSIRVDTPQLMQQVKNVFAEAGDGCDANPESRDRYARAFRSLLSCDTLPADFSVTNGVCVPFYSIGDVVDGLFFIGNVRCWFAGVVVDKRPPKASKGYEVFWIGHPPSKRSNSPNPLWMSVHSLRLHVEGTSGGVDCNWIDIEKIRSTYSTPSHGTVVSEVIDSSLGQGDTNALAERNTGPGAVGSELSGQASAKQNTVPSATGSEPSGQDRLRREPKKRTTEDDEGCDVSKPGKKPVKKRGKVDVHADSSNARGKGGSTPSSSGAQASKPGSIAAEVSKPMSIVATQKAIGTGDSVSFAIETLMSLDRGDPEHPNTFAHLRDRITDMARSLATTYSNPKYVVLVSETLTELKHYSGPDTPQLPHSKEFLDLLANYGFCVTPRMFSRSEILCIGIAMLDTRHHFVRILNKASKEGNVKGDCQGFRGMAFLDSRVQIIMYRRLQRYGFANPRFHPEGLQAFASVVINGGGSWLQSSDWEFNVQSRFVMDSAVRPFAIAVTDVPGVLEGNGLYVASTARRHGQPVYVQVSAIEFCGGSSTKQKDKEFVAFRKLLTKQAASRLKPYALDSQGMRLEPCSPRVLCCKSQGTWGIQLLPGFDTEMFLVQFEWDAARPALRAATASSFRRPLFLGSKDQGTQPCLVTITILAEDAGDVIASDKSKELHYFSFGTATHALRNADDECAIIPGPLLPQGIHSDGPGLYNSAVYTDCGDLKPGAMSCAEAKCALDEWAAYSGNAARREGVSEYDHLNANPWCPILPALLKPWLEEQNDILSHSWSALGAVFSGTYIETLKASGSTNAADGARLRVPIPLGCMGPFTFHWDHGGKGDKTQQLVARQAKPDVHARPHNYVYGSDPRMFPTFDTEATLQFTATCSRSAARTDAGSQVQIMKETLQTFTAETADGHNEVLPNYHEYFRCQKSLNAYLARCKDLQLQPKALAQPLLPITVEKWIIRLEEGSVEGSVEMRKRVRIAGNHCDDSGKMISFFASAADFDSVEPLFVCSDGKRYQLRGSPNLNPQGLKLLGTDASGQQLDSSEFVSLVDSAISKLVESWCSATLHHLLCLLDTRVLQSATLRINDDNILEATSGAECIKLLPFYTRLKRVNMRLYTVRGNGRRLAVPDPYPIITDWGFVRPSDNIERPGTNSLGFRAIGILAFHPGKDPSLYNKEFYTSTIARIDSEGVVTTVNGTSYRLEGNHNSAKCEDSIREVMKEFPAEGQWFMSGKASLQALLKKLGSILNPECKQKPDPRAGSEGTLLKTATVGSGTQTQVNQTSKSRKQSREK